MGKRCCQMVRKSSEYSYKLKRLSRTCPGRAQCSRGECQEGEENFNHPPSPVHSSTPAPAPCASCRACRSPDPLPPALPPAHSTIRFDSSIESLTNHATHAPVQSQKYNLRKALQQLETPAQTGACVACFVILAKRMPKYRRSLNCIDVPRG